MTIKRSSNSSQRWLKEHFRDKYVQQAHKKKLRSRAWFKLSEIQKIDNIFNPGMTVVDLGASPGGWSQYVMTQIKGINHIIACDMIPMDPIVGVDFFQGDIRNESVLQFLLKKIGKSKVHVVMSDMAPNICGIPSIDTFNSMHLVEIALVLCHNILASKGNFIVKILQSNKFEKYLKKVRSQFMKVKVRKPCSSRITSREVYVVATGYKYN